MPQEKKTQRIDWEYPSGKFKVLLPSIKARHRVLYGGRGGGKSWAAAMMALDLSNEGRLRILCTREIQESLSGSMYQLLRDLIQAKNLEDIFHITQNGIANRVTGSEFIFKGMHDIKSQERIDLAIVEEAQDVSKENAERLIPTVRGNGSEIWWLFNPHSEEDWVYDYFLAKPPPPNTVIAKISYYENAQCPQVLLDEAEHLRNTDYEEYRHIWLGELKPKNKGWGFINPLWLDWAAEQGRIKPLGGRAAGRWSIGCDPAFTGRDKWVTIEGMGNSVKAIDIVGYSNSETIAASLNARVLRRGRFNCDLAVDCVGTGTGVGDILEGRYQLADCLQKLNRKDVDFVPPLPLGSKGIGIENFDCWKSQAWHLLKCDLEDCNIDLSEIAASQPEDYRQLCREILAHDMTADKTGKMRVTQKEQVRKELGCSPDIADAFVAWNWGRKREDRALPKIKTYSGKDFFADKPRGGADWLL